MKRTDPNGKDWWDMVRGAGDAILDNLTGINIRGDYNPTSSSDYNKGQNTGDWVSIITGEALSIAGVIEAGGGAALAPETGGISIAVVAGGAVNAVAGQMIATRATENLSSQKGRVSETSKQKEVGSYTNTHESGKKYHGKGDEARMNQSAKDKAKKYNDPVVNKDFTPAKNDREAFKQESRRLEKDKVGNTPGHKNPNNWVYAKIRTKSCI